MKTTTINIGGEDIFCYDDKTKVSTFLCERHNVRFAHSKASVAFWHFVLGDSLRHPAPALSPLKIAEFVHIPFSKSVVPPLRPRKTRWFAFIRRF